MGLETKLPESENGSGLDNKKYWLPQDYLAGILGGIGAASGFFSSYAHKQSWTPEESFRVIGGVLLLAMAIIPPYLEKLTDTRTVKKR